MKWVEIGPTKYCRELENCIMIVYVENEVWYLTIQLNYRFALVKKYVLSAKDMETATLEAETVAYEEFKKLRKYFYELETTV